MFSVIELLCHSFLFGQLWPLRSFTSLLTLDDTDFSFRSSLDKETITWLCSQQFVFSAFLLLGSFIYFPVFVEYKLL